MSTAHHPETNGQTENANKQVLQIIQAQTLEHERNWVDYLPYTKAALNRRKDSARKRTPFEIAYGFNLQLCGEWKSPPVLTERFIDFYKNQQQLIKSKISQSIQTNHGRRPPPMYRVGDKVLLSTKNLPLATAYKKTAPQWARPFQITKAYPATDNYTLQLPKEYKRVHSTFHVRLLKWYIENDNIKFPSRKLTRPGPLPEFKDEEKHTVERLLARKIDKKGKVKYKVKWKGYGNETTWEPVDNIDSELLEDYAEKQKLKNPKITKEAIQSRQQSRRRYRYEQWRRREEKHVRIMIAYAGICIVTLTSNTLNAYFLYCFITSLTCFYSIFSTCQENKFFLSTFHLLLV